MKEEEKKLEQGAAGSRPEPDSYVFNRRENRLTEGSERSMTKEWRDVPRPPVPREWFY